MVLCSPEELEAFAYSLLQVWRKESGEEWVRLTREENPSFWYFFFDNKRLKRLITDKTKSYLAEMFEDYYAGHRTQFTEDAMTYGIFGDIYNGWFLKEKFKGKK